MDAIYAVVFFCAGCALGRWYERCNQLERRCLRLEEDLYDAQSQLSTEQRQLDRKLAAILPAQFTLKRKKEG
jgi:hypothetical protein